MSTSDQIQGPVVKVVTAWAAIGITSWAEAASFAAFIYTIVLILEWIWKRAAKPFAVRRGWIADRRVPVHRKDEDE